MGDSGDPEKTLSPFPLDSVLTKGSHMCLTRATLAFCGKSESSPQKPALRLPKLPTILPVAQMTMNAGWNVWSIKKAPNASLARLLCRLETPKIGNDSTAPKRVGGGQTCFVYHVLTHLLVAPFLCSLFSSANLDTRSGTAPFQPTAN